MPHPRHTIGAFLTSREVTCRASTIATYRFWLESYAAWAGDQSICPGTIGAYLAALRARKLSAETVYNNFRALKTFCRWLVDQGHLDRDPFSGPGRVPPPPRPRQRRAVLSECEIARLLAATAEPWQRGWHAREWDAERLEARALVLLLCDSAMRAGEVAALTCGQVRAPELVIVGKGGHAGVVFLSAPTRAALLELADAHLDDEPLFLTWDGRPATVRVLRGLVVRLAMRAGVTLPPRPLHSFRHWAARQWLKKGMPDLVIQQLMRHASLGTTQLYTRLETAELAVLHAAASPIDALLQAAGIDG